MKEMKKSCISVIIPIYNMSVWLDRCIQSIIHQTYKNLEILLINDGSTDNSKDICERYQKLDSRVILYNKENGGLSDARNFGIEQSKGEYLAFVDSDDWVEEDFFQKLIDHLEGEGADIACVGFDYIYDNKREVPAQPMKTIKMNQKQCMRQLCRNKWFTSYVWNKLYRRRVFGKIRFPFGENYEDIAIMHELIMRANYIVCSDEILYHYFMRPESIVHVKSAKNEMDNFRAYLKRLRAVDEWRWKRNVLKCCAGAAFQILFLSENQFEETEYEEVLCFWKSNAAAIRFLGIKYGLMYTFPGIYKKCLCGGN
nr:glycosyltransferase family 2 protein [uncultured Acetatifactor sp.]